MMDQTTALLIFAPSVVLIYLYLNKKNRLPLPPGPTKRPFLGNLFDIPSEWPAQRYARWGKELDSDVIHLSAPGQDIVVLNSVAAATDLLEKKSAIYSSRPSMVMISNLMGWGWLVSALPYGQLWKDRRRMFQSYFSPGNAAAYQPAQAIHSAKTLLKLLEKPSAFLEVTRHEIGSLALSVTYGIETADDNDPFLGIAELAGQSFEKATSQSFLVDAIPVIRWFPSFLPGAGFQKKAYNWSRIQKAFREEAFKMTEIRSILQVSRPSFVTAVTAESTDHLDAEQKHGRQQAIKDTAGTVFAAGADTTLSGIHAFFAAMLYYPDAQKKAQDELDRVLPGRLPELADEPDLPYVTALVREVLRWQPATPIAVPHASVAEDVYKGYRIPRDSIVIPNIWAMLHDETDYPLPEHFNPDRFLDQDGLLNSKVRDPTDIAFGFGRRVCPGKHIALSTTWLTIARVLSTFNISKATNEAGEPVAPSVHFKSGMIVHPESFACTIKPRSPEAERLIRSAAAAASALSESLTPPSVPQGKLSVGEVKEMTAGLLEKMANKSRTVLGTLQC